MGAEPQDQGTQQGGHSPVTAEDIVTMQTVAQVAISPDGSRVAYMLGTASKAGEHPESRIWLAQVDGAAGAPAPFTGGPGADSAPRWSPDGRSLAFLSDRERRGTAQLYVIALQGGEARRLTDWRGGVADPQWSPDGTMLSYLAIAAPSEEATRRKEDRDDAIVASEVQGLRRLWVIGADGEGARPISADDRHVDLHAWSPDGARIAATTAATPEWNEHFGATRLGVYPIGEEGGARDLGPAPLTGNIVWARDGRRLFTRSGSVDLFPQTAIGVWPLDGDGPVTPRRLLEDLPATIFWLGRARDEDDLLALTWQETHTPLYRVSLDDGRAEALPIPIGERGRVVDTVVGAIPSISVSSDGGRLALLYGDGGRADDVWVWDRAAGLRQLTDANPWLRERRLGAQREVRWRSADGEWIGGLLITPPEYEPGRRYPLVVNVHGGPTWLWTDHLHLNWHDWGQWLAAAGLLVLLPNPRGSAGRGNRFAYANVRDIGGGDYRDLIAGVDYLIAEGLADPDRLGIGGWSYGGTLTPWTLTQTDRFRCAVMGAGLSNWVSFAGTSDIRIFADRLFDAETHRDASALWARSALSRAAHVTTPTLVVHGEKDVRVPVTQGREFYSALRHMGVPTDFVVYPREGHSFTERHHQRDLLERVRAWFVRYLLEGAPA